MAATDDPPPNVRLVSTTWTYRKVKLRGPRPEGQPRPAQPGRFSGLAKRDRKARITLTIHHRGGAESWWLVEARGRKVPFPGHRALEDVMAEINRDWDHPR